MNSGIPFFPLDVALDSKFELIEAEFGLVGFAVIVKLLQRIYGGHGYYCEFDEEVALLFSKSVNVGGSAVSEILLAAIRRGIFSKNLYDKYQILTSRGIQERYLKATSRRQTVEMKKEYLLVKVNQNYKNVNILAENVCSSDKNVYISKQSIVEDSIVEDSKEVTVHKRTTTTKFSKPTLKKVSAYCKERNNSIDPQRFIDYYDANGWKVGRNPMKDWKAAIRTWERNGKTAAQAASPKKSKFNNYGDEKNAEYAEIVEMQRQEITGGIS